MKKILLIVFVVIMVDFGSMAQSGAKSKNLRPEKFTEKVDLAVSGKTQHYYPLSADLPSTLIVEGPGKLRVITRCRFTKIEGKKQAYKVLYSIDGGELKIVKETGVARSSEATYKNGPTEDVPGELKSFEIQLGRGRHTIEFKTKESTSIVSARYVFSHINLRKIEWVAFSPKIPSEPVDLITKEEIVNYYRFSGEKPMVIELAGPTELQVLTRIENHYQMKGRIIYRVQVKENDKVINTYQLSSIRSEVTVYKTDPKLIPGRAGEIVINVPKGKHTYTILPLDQDKNTLLGRLLIPKKSVKLKK